MSRVLTSLLGLARFVGVMVLLCGLAYPLVATAIGGVLFPVEARGSLVVVNGRPVGSRLVGQPFVADRYLHGRPSSCGHDPRALAGSNLAASNPALRARVAADAAAVAAREDIAPSNIPPDLVAASGSCVDPHVTPAAARLQAPRIARARGVDAAVVRAAIDDHVLGEGPLSLGAPRVSVLEVNLALDRLATAP